LIWNFDFPDLNYPKPPTNALLLYAASGLTSDTPITNGTVTGTILGTASTTPDPNGQCYGTHRFALVSTGG